MIAILRDQKLAKYIEKDAAPPTYANPMKPTEDKRRVIKAWKEDDYQMQTRIELSIVDAEMVHILGAKMGSEMWKQLTLIKETRGKMGILMA